MKRYCCLLSVIIIIGFLSLGTGNAWGLENRLELLSDEEKAIYYNRLAELQKLGEELFHVIINQDVDKLLSLIHDKIMVSIGVDYWLRKSELAAQLRDKNSYLYCYLFKSPCDKIGMKSYEYNGTIKTIKLTSVRDDLKNAKNLKIKAEIKKRFEGGYYLDWGYVRFDWEGKSPDVEEKTFAPPSFTYRDGRWWLDSLF